MALEPSLPLNHEMGGTPALVDQGGDAGRIEPLQILDLLRVRRERPERDGFPALDPFLVQGEIDAVIGERPKVLWSQGQSQFLARFAKGGQQHGFARGNVATHRRVPKPGSRFLVVGAFLQQESAGGIADQDVHGTVRKAEGMDFRPRFHSDDPAIFVQDFEKLFGHGAREGGWTQGRERPKVPAQRARACSGAAPARWARDSISARDSGWKVRNQVPPVRVTGNPAGSRMH